MKVLVSACIMGENCKYNGKNNKNSAAIHFLKDKEVISICPEVLAGMETPRPCAEIVNGRVVDENGNDVSLEYNKAVAVALSKIQNEEIDLVILQSRSPTCGVNQIYDGSFTGKLVSGMGLFAKALKQKGYQDVELCLALPFEGYDSDWDDWHRKRMDFIRRYAEKVLILCETPSSESYKKRNYYMVEQAGYMIAVYDNAHNMRSGTQQAVNYAKKKGLQIIYIHPDTAQVAMEDTTLWKK